MIILISPAKTMDFANSTRNKQFNLLPKSSLLLQELKKLDVEELSRVIQTSHSIAQLNFDRYHNFDELPIKEAFYAYDGDVYKNIDRELTKSEEEFAQNHLNIISAFYGLLKPLDPIKPYRLEMVTKIPALAQSLVEFWQQDVTEALNAKLTQHENKVVINLASNEYSKVINRKALNANMIDIIFLEERKGELKNIAINAKRARGMLTSYILQNKIDDESSLQDFAENGYKFAPELSNKNRYYFVKY